MPKGESIVAPPSHCGHCGEQLKPLDLVPVLSYIFLRGKCRYCKEKVSLRYPLIELLTGAAFAFSYFRFGLTLMTIESMILSSIIIIVSFIDIDHHLILNRFSVVTMVVGIVFVFLNPNMEYLDALYGFLIGGGVLFIIAVVGPMGGGDIKWMAGLGLILGFWKTVLAMYLGVIIGAVISVILIVLKIKKMKSYVAFGPFLGIGAFLAFHYFKEIVELYLKLIGY